MQFPGSVPEIHKPGVFRKLIGSGVVLTYVDDLIIPSADFEATLTNLKEVLCVAGNFGLDINWNRL